MQGDNLYMEKVKHMTRESRRDSFLNYVSNTVKSNPERYLTELEKAYNNAPINGFESIFDIVDYTLLEDKNYQERIKATEPFIRESSGGTQALAAFNKYIKFLNRYF